MEQRILFLILKEAKKKRKNIYLGGAIQMLLLSMVLIFCVMADKNEAAITVLVIIGICLINATTQLQALGLTALEFRYNLYANSKEVQEILKAIHFQDGNSVLLRTVLESVPSELLFEATFYNLLTISQMKRVNKQINKN